MVLFIKMVWTCVSNILNMLFKHFLPLFANISPRSIPRSKIPQKRSYFRVFATFPSEIQVKIWAPQFTICKHHTAAPLLCAACPGNSFLKAPPKSTSSWGNRKKVFLPFFLECCFLLILPKFGCHSKKYFMSIHDVRYSHLNWNDIRGGYFANGYLFFSVFPFKLRVFIAYVYRSVVDVKAEKKPKKAISSLLKSMFECISERIW